MEKTAKTKLGLPIAIFAAAQFVMVLDSSVMNVSISQIVKDLDTNIQGVQLAITAYTLVMASFMLAGAKLGDILGRDRTFAIGLAVYGTGSLITALSPSLPVLLFGWSLIEGLGAVMVIPAIVSLIAGTYEGANRAKAFGIVGGVAGAAIAAGPLIGGWVTTNFSWRYVFAGEVVIVIAVLIVHRTLPRSPSTSDRRPKLDLVGAGISAIGLGLIVFGILQSSAWGLIEPKGAMTIGGQEITPFGFSVVPFLLAAGAACLAGFALWEKRQEHRHRDALLDRSLLRIRHMQGGLTTLAVQQLLLLGTFFVMPVYLQVVLGLDAFETGKKLFPMSVTMFLAAMLAPRFAGRWSPRRISQAGLAALVAASILLLASLDVELARPQFAIALAVFGVGAGLLLSQLGNVIMSSVHPSQTNEAGGLQGTAQNLGASLGTALIGAILIAALSNNLVTSVESNDAYPAAVQQQVAEIADRGMQIVPVDQVEQTATEKGVPADQAKSLADDYGEAQLHGLKTAVLAVALLGLLSFWFTRKLPGRRGEGGEDDVPLDGMAGSAAPDRGAAVQDPARDRRPESAQPAGG